MLSEAVLNAQLSANTQVLSREVAVRGSSRQFAVNSNAGAQSSRSADLASPDLVVLSTVNGLNGRTTLDVQEESPSPI